MDMRHYEVKRGTTAVTTDERVFFARAYMLTIVADV